MVVNVSAKRKVFMQEEDESNDNREGAAGRTRGGR